MFYNRHGEPIPMRQWLKLFGDREYQLIDVLEENGIKISTIWLGVFMGGGPPLIFESMIFGEGCPWDQSQWRYATEEQAKRGHNILVACFRENLNPKEAMEKLYDDDFDTEH